MKVPLSKPYVDEEMKQKVLEVIDSGQYILGGQCKSFETEFAKFIGTKHAVLTSSGTSALFLSLKAMGVGPGDEVLVPSLTAFPTIEPVFHVGAQPVFIDIDDVFGVDVKHIEKVIASRKQKVKAIVPVHLYGHPVDLDPILDLAKRHGLLVLEDCCQAHGAKYKGKRVGSMGVAGCFSFYPSKNLTVFGDGGVLVTNDDTIAATCRMLRDHGRKEKYEHELVGYNLRFNEIQAAVGRLQLKRLDGFNESRRQLARWYNEGLAGTPVITPKVKEWAEPVFHLYVIQTDKRDALADYLKGKEVQTGIHYPIPNHQQPAVRNTLGVQPKLEKTEVAAGKILSLPMYPELKKEQVDYVCAMVKEFFGKKN
ncbi:MAG: DegT/DnrJ/EryC1/StrS family aminotransferase [Deltaproteobacteria bacterium]